MNSSPDRSGRETRLLLLVVVVSLTVLLLLARFRFPASTLAVSSPAPSPLAGLAGRATFDDLASTLNTVLTRVSPSLDVVYIDMIPPEPAAGRRGGSRESAPAAASAVERRAMPALRIAADLALVHVPTGSQVVPAPGTSEPVSIVTLDPRRELVLMRVPPRADFRGALPAGNMTGFAYVAALDATPGGPTVQPVFVGRVEAVSDNLWPGVLWVLGRTSQAEAGSFLFSIDGRLIGLITRHALGFVVVPAETLDAVVAELMRPPALAPSASPSRNPSPNPSSNPSSNQ